MSMRGHAMGGGRGGGMERHALHAPGPGRPAAPGQEGHGPAHAHLRRPLPGHPGRLPPRRHHRRRRRRRQPPHPAGHHQQRHREARRRPGHLAVAPGGRPRPRRRRARPHRAPHLGLHRRVASFTTCAPRCSGTSSACRWPSSPGPRPARWSAASTTT